MAVQSAHQGFPAYKSNSITVAKNEKTNEKTTALSETAQKYLDALKEKYSNVNFIVKDYSDSEEASRYLAEVKGGGDYNCIITPALLEKMAADESVAEEYEAIIAGAGQQFESIKEELGEDADKVETYGISVNDKGEVSFYAIMKKGLEDINKSREELAERRAEKKEAEKNREEHRLKEVMLKADTIEGLIQKIKDAVAGKADIKNKDVFEKEAKDTDEKMLWSRVGGKSDGFDPAEHVEHKRYRDAYTKPFVSNGKY